MSKLTRTIAAILAAATMSCAIQPMAAPQTAAAHRATPVTFSSAAADAVRDRVARQIADVEVPAVETELQRLSSDDISTKHGLKATEILKSTYHLPMGAEIAFELDGEQYVAKIENHYHIPEVHPLPWGWHRGISLFKVVSA